MYVLLFLWLAITLCMEHNILNKMIHLFYIHLFYIYLFYSIYCLFQFVYISNLTFLGRLQHEAGRVGRSVQDRPGGQGQEGRQVLLRCRQGLGQGGARPRRSPGTQSIIRFFAFICFPMILSDKICQYAPIILSDIICQYILILK